MNTKSGLAAVREAAQSGASTIAIEAGTAAAPAARAGAKDTGDAKVIEPASTAAETRTVTEPAAATADVSAARAEGAKTERARIKAIVGSDAAKNRQQLAQSLAFNSDLTAEAAIAILGDAPEAARSSRLDGHVPQPKVDANESQDAAAPGAALAAATQKMLKAKGLTPLAN
jgi:hypothetical protein